MEEKIDLEAILSKYPKFSIFRSNGFIGKELRELLKDVVRRTLIVASEKALVKYYDNPYSHGVDKQSILDVEKLIV